MHERIKKMWGISTMGYNPAFPKKENLIFTTAWMNREDSLWSETRHSKAKTNIHSHLHMEIEEVELKTERKYGDCHRKVGRRQMLERWWSKDIEFQLHGRISSEDLLHTMTTINNNML
jgi:hypothetical protein